jgi:hypothetical protein
MLGAEFEQELLALLTTLRSESAQITDAIERTVVRHLRRMSDMGRELRRVVLECCPAFPMPNEPRSWLDTLPPMDAPLLGLLERHV